VSSGIITAEQASLIRADVIASAGSASSPSRRAPLLGEAAAYAGIVAMLVAAALIGADFPASVTVNIGLSAALTGALWAAALAVRRGAGASMIRIRSVLLSASLGTFAAALILLTHAELGWPLQWAALATAALTLIVAAVQWRLHRRLLQHAGVLSYAVVTAAIAATFVRHDVFQAVGTAIWATGAIWSALAWGGVIAPRRGGLVLGSIAAVAGASALMVPGGTTVLATATVLALVLLAVAIRDLALLTVALVSALFVLPVALDRFVHPLATPAALLGAGALLLAAVVVASRRQRDTLAARPQAPSAGREWAAGSRPAAVVVAAFIAAGTTAAILVIGL
jgi:hypothetical protein